jgi:ERCC4-type nuclease
MSAATTTSTPVTLVLDIRERALAEALGRLGGDTPTFVMEPMDVGDFGIRDASGAWLLVAERKTHADFAASNADGRYREQRARMMALRAQGQGVAVLYVLEGVWSSTESRTYGLGRTTEIQLKRLATRLALRYGLPVLAADTIADTARWCRLLVAQLTDDPTAFRPEGGAEAAAMVGFTAALSTVKRENRTGGSVAAAMLSAIPGLGEKRCIALLADRSIADLAGMSAAEIAALVVGGRRLGPKLGETIVTALTTRAV